jgi:hypothetical protein
MGDRLTDVYAPAVTPHLAPGERIVVIDIPQADPGVTGPVSVRDELLNLLDPTIWFGLGAHPGELLRLLTWGRAVVGRPDSIAARLHEAIGKAEKVVITDQRIVLGSVEVPTNDPDTWRFTSSHSEPRASVRHAERAPKGLLRRGRMLWHCADESVVAISVAFGRQAQRMADALNG